MRDLQRTYEAFQFACPACDTRWCRVYEVTTHAEPDGLASKDYRRADLLVSAPLDDRDCPSCGTAATVLGPTLADVGQPGR